MKKSKFKFFNFILIAFLIMLLFLLLISNYSMLDSNIETAKADSGDQYTRIEMLNNVEENFTFEVFSEISLTDKNIMHFVTITNIEGMTVPIVVSKIDDYYEISPKTNYNNGNTYKINLAGSVRFKNPSYINGLLFSIKKPDELNSTYNESLIHIDNSDVISVDAENKSLVMSNTDFKIGDILIIPTLIPNTKNYIDVAYKVESIDGNYVEFSTPELDEVYSDFSISGEFCASDAVAYEKEEIINQILNAPEIDAISKAIYDFRSGSVEKKSISLKPKKIDIEFNNFDPLDVNCLIIWEITNNLNFCLKFNYKSSTSVEFVADKSSKKQVTKQQGTWSIEVDLQGDIYSLNTNSLFKGITSRNKYSQTLVDAYNADKHLSQIDNKLHDPNLSLMDKFNLEKQREQVVSQLNYVNIEKQFLARQNKYAALLELQTLSDYYKKQISKSNSQIKFVQLFFPVAPGVAFTVDVGCVLDFSISAAMSAKMVVSSVNEIGTLTTQNSQTDSTNSYYKVSAYVGVTGVVEIKIGAQIGVGVTIAGVFNLSLNFQGGLYVELSAIGAIRFGDTDNLSLTQQENDLFGEAQIIDNVYLMGAINYDVGAYYLLDFTVSFDLWVVDISKTFEIVGDKTSFIKNQKKQDEYYSELVFENELNIKTFDELLDQLHNLIVAGDKYDTTPIFVIDNDTGSVKLPSIYVRNINLSNGEISYRLLNSEELEVFNNNDVYFEGMVCHANDYFTPELDNKMNIRIKTDDETLQLLSLPVRVVKKPIVVDEIILNLKNGNKVGLTESKQILIDVLPYNATYGNYKYSIDKIEKLDGTLYSNDLSKYAYIENDILYTTKEIEVGSKIYLHATAVHNGVESNMVVVQVTRIEIERVELTAPYLRSDINLDEEIELKLEIYPQNATVNVLNDVQINVELENVNIAKLATIDGRNYVLKAFDNIANIGDQINIGISVENINKSVSFIINAIPIENMIIKYVDSNKELEDVTYLTRGASMNVDVEILPVNATIRNKNYNLFSNTANFGAFVKIDETGKLTIAEDAPFDMEILLNVNSLRQYSKTYKIIVAKREVDNVLLTAEQSYIIKNSIISLNAYIYPEDADVTSTQYKIVNKVTGVFISGRKVFASKSAIADSEVQIVAIVNGVESNVLTLRIIDDPNVEIVPSENGETGDNFSHDSSGSNHFIQDDKNKQQKGEQLR